jgi:hypothetical protein
VVEHQDRSDREQYSHNVNVKITLTNWCFFFIEFNAS